MRSRLPHLLVGSGLLLLGVVVAVLVLHRGGAPKAVSTTPAATTTPSGTTTAPPATTTAPPPAPAGPIANVSVAQVGASGGSADSGLYFELRRDGKPFDPMRWVAQ